MYIVKSNSKSMGILVCPYSVAAMIGFDTILIKHNTQ